MSDWQLHTPVAFIVFNRPATTERVFNEIARARPPKLLVVADGARANRPGEAEKCAAVREIIDRIDWDCELLTNYSDTNLGCKNRVSSGLDWVFEQVPEAIILEDDCLPHPTFFRFCEDLLIRYRDDERIAMISGDNFQCGQKRGAASYYFSKHHHIWGWASWRRAWRHYDRDIRIWPEVRDNGWLEFLFQHPRERDYWHQVFESMYANKIDTWDYQWGLSSRLQGMLSILPNVNLISNIGFGIDATHTTNSSVNSELPVSAMDFPLRHPNVILPDFSADAATVNATFSSTLYQRARQRIKALIS